MKTNMKFKEKTKPKTLLVMESPVVALFICDSNGGPE